MNVTDGTDARTSADRKPTSGSGHVAAAVPGSAGAAVANGWTVG